MICPYCKEEIKDGATTCIHCKHTIFSENPHRNVLIILILTSLLFLGIVMGTKACAKHEMKKIKKESEEYTEQLLKDWRM